MGGPGGARRTERAHGAVVAFEEERGGGVVRVEPEPDTAVCAAAEKHVVSQPEESGDPAWMRVRECRRRLGTLAL
jgi:hypothetical protein